MARGPSPVLSALMLLLVVRTAVEMHELVCAVILDASPASGGRRERSATSSAVPDACHGRSARAAAA